MITGLRTAIYYVSDMQKAKEWYSKILEKEPYFDQPFYIGFNVGGFELGLHPLENENKKGEGGSEVYWGVKDLKNSLKILTENGAKILQDVLDVGEGILIASVIDPFGNVFGIIENPQFKFEE